MESTNALVHARSVVRVGLLRAAQLRQWLLCSAQAGRFDAKLSVVPPRSLFGLPELAPVSVFPRRSLFGLPELVPEVSFGHHGCEQGGKS